MLPCQTGYVHYSRIALTINYGNQASQHGNCGRHLDFRNVLDCPYYHFHIELSVSTSDSIASCFHLYNQYSDSSACLRPSWPVSTISTISTEASRTTTFRCLLLRNRNNVDWNRIKLEVQSISPKLCFLGEEMREREKKTYTQSPQ